MLEQFTIREGLEHIAKPAAILLHFGGTKIKQGGQQTGIDKLQLGCFDNTLEPVPGPNLNAPEQVHLLKHPDVKYGIYQRKLRNIDHDIMEYGRPEATGMIILLALCRCAKVSSHYNFYCRKYVTYSSALSVTLTEGL